MPTNWNSKRTVLGILLFSAVAAAAIAAVVQPAVMLNVRESISVADTPRALPAVILNVRESISVADAPTPVSAALVNDHEPVSVTDSVTVKIIDVIPPTTTATLTSARACGVTDVLLSATDNPGGSGVKNIQYSIDRGPAVVVAGASTSITFTTDGVHSLTFFATDNAGNVEASHTLSIPVDQTAPHITCPAPIATECTGGSSAVVTPGAAQTSDLCSAVTVSGPAAGSYPLGSTTVTYIATDGSNNTNSCTSTITVVDTTPPSIICPAPVTAECTGNASAPVTPAQAIASDTCSSVTVLGPAAGSYPLGDTKVAYTAKDTSNNASSCTSDIVVVDTIPPSITCPATIAVECSGNESAFVNPDTATASDICTAPTISGPAAGFYPLGQTTVTYTAKDMSNNASACSTQIDVLDTIKPTIACPPPVTAECTGNQAAFVSPGAALASDICSAVTVQGPAAGLYPLGDTVVEYTAKDVSNNVASCTSDIVVVDTTPPTITCPAAMTVECTGNASASVTPAQATASDICSAVTVTGPAAGSYPLGTTTVTYKATDQSNNSSSCATTIRVTDTAPPVFDPASLGPRTVVGSCSNTPLSFALPTASDACTTPTVSCDALSGASFGSNLVHCTATDASGNVTRANLVVNVLQPLHVIFDPPLKDDNVADDVNTDADVNNLFTVGQVIPHKVRLLDCRETDVTATVPVTVKLVVSKGATGGGTDLINDVGDFSGIGDVGGLMILVGNQYQFNLKTDKAEYPSGGVQFQSLVTVSYTSAPGLVAGVEDARLVSR